jgi:pilus assembly protein CpaC
MLESSGKRRWRRLVSTVCAVGVLGGELLGGGMLRGQQPSTPATGSSWNLLAPSLVKRPPLKAVAVEEAEKPAEQPAAPDDSLPPIVSSANMPRPSRTRQPTATPAVPNAAEATQVQAVPVAKPSLVSTPAVKNDVPLPAGKPASSSPWMQDIRMLVETTPGPKTPAEEKKAAEKTDKLAGLLAEKLAAKAAEEQGTTKQVQYEGNEPLPATAPPAEIVTTPVLAVPGNDLALPAPPSEETPEGVPQEAEAAAEPRLATVPQNTLPLTTVPPAPQEQQPAQFGPPAAPAFPQAQPVNLLAQPPAEAQPVAPPPLATTPGQRPADPQVDAMRAGGSPFEVIDESGAVQVMVRRSKLLRTKVDIYRTAVVDDSICEIVQFTPREVSLIGKSQGSTHVTFWFDNPNMQPVTYVVQVVPDVAEVTKIENNYRMLQDVINEMFPDSKIQLLIVADKLIVRGQAKDSEEAAQIIALVRSQSGNYTSGAGGAGWGGGLSEGAAAQVLSDSATGSAQRSRLQVINMLRVPGVQQVALRVKIAEMNRSAARGFGVDLKGHINFTDNPNGSQLFLQSMLNVAAGAGPALLTQVDGDDIQIGIRYLQSHGVLRLLSEPTLVTMSGTPATFIAGGEFAVPTLVGSAGLNAVTTDFRAYGAIISFMPTVVDKDRIRLQVSPEFSQLNNQQVNNTPTLRVRAATTTVEMREGQTLAIAGLLEDNMNGTNVGDVPFLAKVFGRREMNRNETELLILVTPELVHAMEPEEVPPLPGFDVTEPTSAQFFLQGRLEGNPTQDYRSTVWPRLKKRYGAGGPAMTSGPFGHGQ